MILHEIGPIRPPSEADSLLIRVTRNCPWNMCKFCPVYKGMHYEPRDVKEVLDDIRTHALQFQEITGNQYQSAFLQDADPLILQTSDLILILRQISETFPKITTITTYARAATLAKKPLDELIELKNAGLTRIHRGLESGYDALLGYMKKGATARLLIEGGQNVKRAGILLCDYVMPGLGGNLQLENQETWRRHAEETAKVLNEINPDYIRLRTLIVKHGSPLWQKVLEGEFRRLSDQEIVGEIRYFLELLNGISSQIESDHLSNVLMELRGKLPQDKQHMLAIIDRYLKMSLEQQYAFRIGMLTRGPHVLDEFENDYGSGSALEQVVQRLLQNSL